VIESGNVVKEGSPKEVFSDASWLLEKQLGVPTTLAFVEKLKEKGWSTDKMPLTLDELADAILEERGVNE
jgi:cobalt import ATP-binding protein cbiO 2